MWPRSNSGPGNSAELRTSRIEGYAHHQVSEYPGPIVSLASTKFTIEQKLPEQLFKSSSGEVIYNGKKTYYCSSGDKRTTCVVYGSIHASPLEGLVGVYSASTYITVMQTWQSMLAYNLAGVHI